MPGVFARATTHPRCVVPIDGKLVEYQNTNPLVGPNGWHIALSETACIDVVGRCPTLEPSPARDSIAMVCLDAGPTAFPERDAIHIRRFLLVGELT